MLRSLLTHEGPLVHRLPLIAVNAGDALSGLPHVLLGEGVTVSVLQQVLKVLVTSLVAPTACAEHKRGPAVIFGPTSKSNRRMPRQDLLGSRNNRLQAGATSSADSQGTHIFGQAHGHRHNPGAKQTIRVNRHRIGIHQVVDVFALQAAAREAGLCGMSCQFR